MQSGLIIRVQVRDNIDFDLLNKVKAKLFLDSNNGDYDELLKGDIARAIDDVERFTGLAIGAQTRKVSYSILTESTALPYGPYLSTVSITDGGVVDEDGRLSADWPLGGAITYRCGYGTDTVPAALLGAVVLAAAEYSGLNPALARDGWKASVRRYRTFTWAS